MKDDIQHQVDQLLLEQGEYLPLELLLQAGRLDFSDYEAWRLGELRRLEEALFGDAERVRQQLLAAEEYLQRRGWQAEAIIYSPWPGAAASVTEPVLHFSADEALNACFHRRYRPPPDRAQMDLFTDAPGANLVNAISRALGERDTREARHDLERLYEVAPDHARLGELERLVEAAEDLVTPVRDPAIELERLEQELLPLAESLLGRNARNLLVPLWRRLGAALEASPYRAERPELHASYAASQGMDWETARRAVESVTDWRAEPVLLARHARACEGLRQRGTALRSWFELCWRFPERGQALETSSDAELRAQWDDFLALDPGLPVASFPAWLLLQRPGVTRVVGRTEAELGSCPESYLTVWCLQQQRIESRADAGSDNDRDGQDQVMTWRARFKDQDPVLFRYYLDSLAPM